MDYVGIDGDVVIDGVLDLGDMWYVVLVFDFDYFGDIGVEIFGIGDVVIFVVVDGFILV